MKNQRILLKGYSPDSLQELVNKSVEIINEEVKQFNNEVVYLVLSVRYSDKISNSHCAPVKGVVNWGRDENKTTYYSGYIGRCWIGYKHGKYGDSFFHSYKTGIHTGTGGYGFYGLQKYSSILKIPDNYFKKNPANNDYFIYPLSTDTKIFELDFPNILDDKLLKAENLIFNGEDTRTKEILAHYFNENYR